MQAEVQAEVQAVVSMEAVAIDRVPTRRGRHDNGTTRHSKAWGGDFDIGGITGMGERLEGGVPWASGDGGLACEVGVRLKE